MKSHNVIYEGSFSDGSSQMGSGKSRIQDTLSDEIEDLNADVANEYTAAMAMQMMGFDFLMRSQVQKNYGDGFI